jgi:pyruvate/2-oxoglutarate dehydrogenase complex dihydrolipoamide acyltransferase (E2) component
MQSSRIVTGVFALLLVAPASAPAQQQSRIAPPAELNAAVVSRADAVEQDRARLRALLARPEVRDVARAHGLDLERAQGAVGTLGTTELRQISPLVQGITAQVGGAGGGITITTTTLIIILLLVILLVLVA